ncbi:MAG: flagellar biosynthesis protein FlhF, partial [Gammaproteobacteria bacterium]|nr:flagellar biosynthesis protein FlhF [Gammaproteobacteria bacterium]
MKIVRHTAPDMRQALRSIREQLGEEAVILSSRRTPQGVEITAAVDFDASRIEHTTASSAVPKLHEEPPTPVAAPTLHEEPTSAATSVNDAMGNELKSLRRMLETQLAQLAWNDRTRRAPVHTELLRELTEIGIAQDLADHLVGQLDERIDLTQGRRFALAGLSQYLLVTGDRWLETGGRVAFVGATGVGKTTMLAKLAVRWILRHGPNDLALVAS